MLTLNLEYFKSKPVNIPKITILLDHGYHIDSLIDLSGNKREKWLESLLHKAYSDF